MTELAALAGQPGLFGPPPAAGSQQRHKPPPPPQPELGKRQTKRPVSYAEAGDLDSYLDGSGVRRFVASQIYGSMAVQFQVFLSSGTCFIHTMASPGVVCCWVLCVIQ